MLRKVIRNKNQFDEFLEKIQEVYNKNPKLVYIGKFGKKPKKRNLDQNGLYWLWITCICDELGYNISLKKHVSDELKKVLDYTNILIILGENVYIPISTSTMTESEMAKYMSDVQDYAFTELRINLPTKEDKYFEDFYGAYSTKGGKSGK